VAPVPVAEPPLFTTGGVGAWSDARLGCAGDDVPGGVAGALRVSGAGEVPGPVGLTDPLGDGVCDGVCDGLVGGLVGPLAD
jgi:hypothetical protein